jgi:ABC-2 type transport system ATP-binding protein
MPILETKALTRRFGSMTAVDSLSIAVESGEIFGLLGPNGAGKSTAIKMMTTLLPPSGGEAQIAGYSITKNAPQVRRVIGYVPQLLSADGSLTGYENLLIFAKLYDIPREEREKRVKDALEFMGLSEVGDNMVRTYSGGMIRRLEIAQSMLHRPRLLFLDEPTVGLDPSARRAVWGHIQEMCHEYNMTIFLTTHLMEEADSLCNRVAIMNLGKIATIGIPADLKKSIEGDNVTLDDVFIHYTGGELEKAGGYRETSRARRVASRLG